MTRRTLFSIIPLSVFFLSTACAPDKPRALVVADGSGTVHQVAVDARVKNYQGRTGRQVRILPVEPAQAILLASRGEADVAVVPMDVSIDTFLAAEHGRVAGQLQNGGDRLRILEVSAKQHPKVDEKGAKSLAAALITPP